MMKFAMNLINDRMEGQQLSAEQAKEKYNDFSEKQKLDLGKNQWIL